MRTRNALCDSPVLTFFGPGSWNDRGNLSDLKFFPWNTFGTILVMYMCAMTPKRGFGDSWCLQVNKFAFPVENIRFNFHQNYQMTLGKSLAIEKGNSSISNKQYGLGTHGMWGKTHWPKDTLGCIVPKSRLELLWDHGVRFHCSLSIFRSLHWTVATILESKSPSLCH